MSQKAKRIFGFAVGVAGVITGLGAPYLTLIPQHVGAIITAIAAGILAANGELVKNGHKNEG